MLIEPSDAPGPSIPSSVDSARIIVDSCEIEESDRWDRYVTPISASTVFHRSTWSRILRDTYGFKPILLVVSDGLGGARCVLPVAHVDSPITGRRLVSLPCTNAAGPVGNAVEYSTVLLRAGIGLAQQNGCKYFEVRAGDLENLSDSVGMKKHHYFGTYILELSAGGENYRDRFDRRVKRGIQKASKSHVHVELGHDREAVRAFYDLNLRTRRKHGVPPQPLGFFQRLADQFRSEESCQVLVATWQERRVAAIILLTYRDTVTYAYGASDERFLSCSPNHALFDCAIKWASESGFKYFDFGRTAPDNFGLVEFKRQWGASYAPLPYAYWPDRRGFVGEAESSWKHRLFSVLWRRLPLSISAAMGPAIYRHLV